ncbi:hypothetical protein EMIT0194P_190050 [Pseudomonas serbica]
MLASLWFEKSLLWHTTTLHLLLLTVVHLIIQGLNNLLIVATPTSGSGRLARRCVHVNPVRFGFPRNSP